MPDDFVNFENALRELKLSEDQLKRLVSEGEIRAIRGENNTMRFRRDEIERLKQDTGKTLQYTEESSDTLTDDLLFDEADDLDVDEEGMATAQISSDDTFVGDDTGMTTAPLGDKPAAPRVQTKKGRGRTGSSAAPLTKGGAASRDSGAVRRTTGRSTRMRQTTADQQAVGIGMGVTVMLVVGFLICCYSMLVWWDIAHGSVSGPTRGIASWAGETWAEITPSGK